MNLLSHCVVGQFRLGHAFKVERVFDGCDRLIEQTEIVAFCLGNQLVNVTYIRRTHVTCAVPSAGILCTHLPENRIKYDLIYVSPCAFKNTG